MKLELDQAKEKQEMAKKIKQEKLVRKKENSKQNKVKVIKEKAQLNSKKNKKQSTAVKSNKI